MLLKKINTVSQFDEKEQKGFLSDWNEDVKISDSMEQFGEVPPFDFSEMVRHDGFIGSYPTEECIQLMEKVFLYGGTVEDACRFVGINYKTYKNWTNPRRKFSNSYTREDQNEMLKRLRRAKAIFKLSCNKKLIKMSSTSFSALRFRYNKLEEARKEEKNRFNKLDPYYTPNKDYSIEKDSDGYVE